MSVTCIIAGAAQNDLNQTIAELHSCKLVERVLVLSPENPKVDQTEWLEGRTFSSTTILKEIGEKVNSDFILLYTKSQPLKIGQYAMERMVTLAKEANSGMLYSDYYEFKSGALQAHPTIEYQEGSLRDDFNFGSLLLFKSEAFREAVAFMYTNYQSAGLYDLRLRISQQYRIVHVPEFLYTEVETDMRTSGQKMFDYVDPKNRERQLEMEKACTDYLKKVGAFLEPKFANILFDQSEFPVEASVIIPVRNREKTVGDAIQSVLSQQTSFAFNLIIVDNFSTDGTSEIIRSYVEKDNKVIHVVPDRKDLGIGGCWNVGAHHEQCGKFSVQLDSDDLYIDENVLARIVASFYEQNCAMVVGSYQMVNFKLEEIPPGLIDHKEWTPDNGRNNALRINGLGAPRAFYTPILRQIKVPNTSYGEDYALGLNISRKYQIGRIYEPLYLCRRWEDNSDAALDIQKLNAHNFYKDKIRTMELWARQAYVKSGQPV